MTGLRLALGWFTAAPVRAPVPDRAAASAAIRWAPVVGLALGALTAGMLAAAAALRVPPLVGGVLAVAGLALATRGLHLDGLADTADGLGSYGPPEWALAVLRDSSVGAFGVVTLVLVLTGQAAAMAALAGPEALRPSAGLAVLVAVTAGRSAFLWCCRRGVPAARPDGMGALVAGSQPWWLAVLCWLALGAAAMLAVPARPWQGPLAVALAAVVVVALSAHTARRFGGLVGDTPGAACELSVLAVLVVLGAGG